MYSTSACADTYYSFIIIVIKLLRILELGATLVDHDIMIRISTLVLIVDSNSMYCLAINSLCTPHLEYVPMTNILPLIRTEHTTQHVIGYKSVVIIGASDMFWCSMARYVFSDDR